MITLFIDTSSLYLDVAIIKNEIVYEKKIESINEHSKHAITTIEALFSEQSIKPNDISNIMVINGPGSFTGLRIGVTIAKTYAWSFNLKLIPISTLKAYALSYTNYDYYVSVIDARRGFVYASIYNSNYDELLKESYISIEELYTKIKELTNYILIGNIDIKEIKHTLPNLNINNIYNYYKEEVGVNPHSLVPNYLKKVEAEEKLEALNDKRI